MGILTITSTGNFNKTERYLKRVKNKNYLEILQSYGEKGVQALQDATPKRTGRTAASWTYTIEKTRDGYTISWLNSNTNKGISIALLNQYGHATRDGGWVQGVDYINPAIRPIFEQMADDMWREVSS